MDTPVAEHSSPSRNRAGNLALACAACATVGGLAVEHGGYFPRAWGAASVLLLWVMAAGILVVPLVHHTRLEIIALAGLGGLVGLTALSVSWSLDPSRSMLDAERGLTYLAALAGLILFMRRSSVASMLAGIAAACTLAALYGLATWSVSGANEEGAALSAPLGYSGAVGLFSAMGMLLAQGFALRGNRPATRAVAAAALIPLASAVTLAASRTAFVALAIGWAAAFLLEPRRRDDLAPTAVLAVAPFLAAAISTTDAAGSGRTFGIFLVLLGGGSAAVGLAVAMPRVRVAAMTVTVVLALASAAAAPSWNRPGEWRPSASPTPRAFDARRTGDSLDARLRLWEVAWYSARERPLLGAGAGSYGRLWAARRHTSRSVRDAHNLYLETLAELGVAGLALLGLVLGTALAAGRRARRQPFVPYAAGALTAYVVHAGAHWDWEFAALTVTALACAAALLVSARHATEGRQLPVPTRAVAFAAVLALSALAMAGVVGNTALERSSGAEAAGAMQDAATEAHTAARWQPWSGEPWQLLGSAALAEGHVALARARFRRGLERDPRSWRLWRDLAKASNGSARRMAAARAKHLDPLRPVDAGAAGG